MITFIFILSLILIIRYLFYNNKHFIIPILIFSYIFGGMLNEEYAIYGRLPHEIVIIIVFVLIFTISIMTKKSYFLTITLGDKIFFSFYFMIYLIPLFVNIYDFSNDKHIMWTRELLPLKIWIIYRIFYYIYLTSSISEKKLFYIIISSYVWGMMVSGIIGITRMLDIPILSNLINDTWPLVTNSVGVMYRMQGTVGGVNGGGILFAISAIFSFYLYFIEKKDIYIYTFVVLVIFLLLTASFSSFFVFIFMIVYWSITNKINFSRIFKMVFIIPIFLSLFLLNSNLRNMISDTVYNRVAQQIDNNSTNNNDIGENVLPNSFRSRISIWKNYLNYYVEKPFFGYGYKILMNNSENFKLRMGISESFFVELLMFSGIFGFLFFLFFYYHLIRKLKQLFVFEYEKKLLIVVLIGIFISQISNMSLTYGGIMELFGIIIFLINIFYINNRQYQKKNNEIYNYNSR